MTAARYKLPASFAQLAGQKFGLNLLDLFGDEDEASSSETGGFLPQFSTKVVEKGRGGVLSYKAPRTPTRESTFQLVPALPGQGGASVNIGDISSSSTSTTPKETEKVPEKPSVQISSEFGQDPAYFGHEDYWRNIERGATPKQIQEFLDKNINLLREGNVPGGGGLYDQLKSGNVPTLGSSGSAVYQAQQPKQPEPQPSYQTVSTPSAPSISTQYGASAEYLGHKDIEAAKAGGMSNEQIAQVIKANVGKLREGNLPGGGGLYDQYAQYM